MEIGVSLGGGSLRGLAHIGVLHELERRNISIAYIAGTSSGALIGGLYACGFTPAQMLDIFTNLNWRKYFDIRLPSFALLKGKKIYRDLVRYTEGRHFSDLDIPFATICVDLIDGSLQVMKQGEVAKAIRASMAIPGLFQPVYDQNRILVDGYILNNNPANIVKVMGADFVIASVVKGNKIAKKGLVSNLQRYMNIASRIQTNYQLQENADLIINIDLEKYGQLTWRKLNRLSATLIEEGRRQTAIYLSNNKQLEHISAG